MKKVKINLTYKDILDMLEHSRTCNSVGEIYLKNLDKLELVLLPDSYYLEPASKEVDGDYTLKAPVHINTTQTLINHTLSEEELQYDDIGWSVINTDKLVCKTFDLELEGDKIPALLALKFEITEGRCCYTRTMYKALIDSDIQE